MTKDEAKKALLEGKKVKHESWDDDEYIYFDLDSFCVRDEISNFIWNLQSENGWLIFEEEKKKVTLYRYLYKNIDCRRIEYIEY